MAGGEPGLQMKLRVRPEREADRLAGELFEMVVRRVRMHDRRGRLDEDRRAGDHPRSEPGLDGLAAGEKHQIVVAGARGGERLVRIVAREFEPPAGPEHHRGDGAAEVEL